MLDFLRRVTVFEQTTLLDDLLLFAEDDTDIVGIEFSVEDQSLGEDVFGLFQGQAAGGVQQSLTSFTVEVDTDLRVVFDVFDNSQQKLIKVFRARQSEFDDRNVLRQIRSNVHHR